MKFGTWHFRIGMNRRGNYKPRWFWLVLFGILVAELLYNLISILIHAPINALMVLLLLPMVVFIWTRLWFLIELRTGSVSDRDEFTAYERSMEAEEKNPPTAAPDQPKPPIDRAHSGMSSEEPKTPRTPRDTSSY